jgi:hypothetical protein
MPTFVGMTRRRGRRVAVAADWCETVGAAGSADYEIAREVGMVNEDLKGCSVADVLERLEKGKIGHRAAMEWFNVSASAGAGAVDFSVIPSL